MHASAEQDDSIEWSRRQATRWSSEARKLGALFAQWVAAYGSLQVASVLELHRLRFASVVDARPRNQQGR